MKITNRTTYVCGDTHGDFEELYNILEEQLISHVNIIHVGDLGVCIGDNDLIKLNRFNKKLADLNIHLYSIRGNHDNPLYFEENFMLSNITLLPDYTTLEILDKKILCIGGGISVDRSLRKKNNKFYKYPTYFENEEFVAAYGQIPENVDIVISHIAPQDVGPTHIPDFIRRFSEKDKDLISDLIEERKSLAGIAKVIADNNTNLKWYYGHYHDSYFDMRDDVMYVGLGINEIKDINVFR